MVEFVLAMGLASAIVMSSTEPINNPAFNLYRQWAATAAHFIVPFAVVPLLSLALYLLLKGRWKSRRRPVK